MSINTMLALSLALLVGLSPSQAHADDTKACAADARKLCPGITSGDGRLASCLRQHEAELSTRCQQQRETTRKNVESLVNACRQDAKTLCADTQPGGGRILHCLQAKQDQLSPECRDQLKNSRAARRKSH